MRAQRRQLVTVTLVQVRITSDGHGNHPETTTRIVIPGAILEPAQPMLEGTGPDQAPVMQPAAFNLPGAYDVEADDLLQVGDYPTAPDPSVDVDEWQVVGGGTVWNAGRTRVPVTQVRRR